jgi:hypothetical protein
MDIQAAIPTALMTTTMPPIWKMDMFLCPQLLLNIQKLQYHTHKNLIKRLVMERHLTKYLLLKSYFWKKTWAVMKYIKI